MLTQVSMVSSSGPTTTLNAGAQQFGPCQSINDCTIVDSGTTYLLLPAATYQQLVGLITHEENYAQYFNGGSDPVNSPGFCIPASSVSASLETLQQTLPRLSFTFTDADGNTPTTITIQAIPGYLSINYGESGDMYYCSGLGSTNGYTVLGFAFMNQFTVRHDLNGQRIGFAPTAKCGEAAPPFPNYFWSTGAWGNCTASCGGGVQWRDVLCVDQFDLPHPAIDCADGRTALPPGYSRACNTTPCSSPQSSPTFTSITCNPTVTQGQTYVVSYTYTGGDLDYITLFLSPQQGSSVIAMYIVRNATTGDGGGSYEWTVQSTVPPGSYYLGAYAVQSQAQPYTSTNMVTVQACAGCNTDPCAGGAAVCSGNGECNAVEGQAVCTCAVGYNGSTCAQLLAGCTMQCVNGGTIPSGGQCQCSCPTSFTGALCQLRYANVTATYSLPSTSLDAADNFAVFQSNVVTDLAFALGAFPDDIVIRSVDVSSAGQPVVQFVFITQAATSFLVQALDSLSALLSLTPAQSSTLSSGLTTYALRSITVTSLPPLDTQTSSGPQSAGQWLAQWGPYLAGGIGGFFILFFLLYCMMGGRCPWCRSKLRGKPKQDQVPLSNGRSSRPVVPPRDARPVNVIV